MTLTDDRWGPPPPRPVHVPVWTERLAGLEQRPLEWRQLDGTYGRGQLALLRAGYYQLPPGRWAFEMRPVHPKRARGRQQIWARFLGPEKASA